MSTTVTPISIVRRQDAALTVATTNMMARLIATGRTDSSSPGSPPRTLTASSSTATSPRHSRQIWARRFSTCSARSAARQAST
jgi:hypothetical protein